LLHPELERLRDDPGAAKHPCTGSVSRRRT
jgi:hypothetical protein